LFDHPDLKDLYIGISKSIQAGSRGHGAWSMEQGAWSREQGVIIEPLPPHK